MSNKKQEAQALMAEMESIAQAFEEVQEQNIRLLDQLKVCVCVCVQCVNSKISKYVFHMNF